eukprot:8235860-Pyramimonas_sp.AAC.1
MSLPPSAALVLRRSICSGPVLRRLGRSDALAFCSVVWHYPGMPRERSSLCGVAGPVLARLSSVRHA